jgi:receptor expression-enhancing protein 5/6
MEAIKPHITKFDTFLSQYKFLLDIEKSSSIPKVYLVTTIGLLLSMSVIFDVFAEWTVGILALAYPLHSALKAITKSDANATKSWLLYFSIMAVWSFIDMGGLPAKIIPYYHPVKSLVIIWLTAPNFNVYIFNLQ